MYTATAGGWLVGHTCLGVGGGIYWWGFAVCCFFVYFSTLIFLYFVFQYCFYLFFSSYSANGDARIYDCSWRICHEIVVTTC